MNVYVIASDGGMCKIGVAGDPKSRLNSLSTGHPYGLEVAETFVVEDGRARDIERKAHDILADKRLKGEWFSVSPLEAIAAVRTAIGPVIAAAPRDRCERCNFARFRWRKGETYEQVIVDAPDETLERDHDRIECRRNPPTLTDHDSGWPDVLAGDWCGHFSDAEDDI